VLVISNLLKTVVLSLLDCFISRHNLEMVELKEDFRNGMQILMFNGLRFMVITLEVQTSLKDFNLAHGILSKLNAGV